MAHKIWQAPRFASMLLDTGQEPGQYKNSRAESEGLALHGHQGDGAWQQLR